MILSDAGVYGEIFVGDQKVASFQNWTRDQHLESSQPSQLGGSPVFVPGMHWTRLFVTQLTCFDNNESFCRGLDDPSRSINLRFAVKLYDNKAGNQVAQYALAQFMNVDQIQEMVRKATIHILSE